MSVFILASLCSLSARSEALDETRHDHDAQTTVTAWLTRMDEALEQRHYKGLLAHQVGQAERQVRLLHAYLNGERYLRLQLVGGPESEIILRGNEFICLHPKFETDGFRQINMAQPDRFRNIAERLPELSRYYQFSLLPPQKICDRQAIGIDIHARDRYRLNHQLWLDTATGLLLKGVVISQNQEVLEQFEFLQIDPDVELTVRDFDVDSQDVRRIFSENIREQDTVQLNRAILARLEWLPPGFRPTEREVRKLSGRIPGMESVMFSDGLTSFTVFVERKRPANSPTSVAYEPVVLPDVLQGATLTHSRLTRVVNEVGGLEPVVTTIMGEITFPAASKVLKAFNGERLH